MDPTFSRTWRALAARGIAGIVFGVLLFALPRMALSTLLEVFGLYAFVDGACAVVSSLQERDLDHARIVAVEGFIGVALGLTAFAWRAPAAPAHVVQIVAWWAISSGGLEIAAANRLRMEIPGELFLLLAGAASVLLGLAMLVWPAAGPLVYGVLLGAYALFFGTAMLLVALHMHRAVVSYDAEHGALEPRDRPAS